MLPLASVYDVPKAQTFVSSSVSAVGVKVPVQVTPPFADVIVPRAPFGQLTSALLANPTTASLNVKVRVGVSPVFIAVSLNENTETVGCVFLLRHHLNLGLCLRRLGFSYVLERA